MTNQERQNAIDKWTKENTPVGKKLGYPACCIKEFCNQPPEVLKESMITRMDKLRWEAGHMQGKFTGFIPCADHAIQIMQGHNTLESLITNRDESIAAFPNYPEKIL